MHVVVLGAGIAGVTTAYYLSRLGHSVTIIEKGATVANGASHANGGQLAYSYTDAFANPAMLTRLPGLACGKDPAILIRGGPHASLVRWGLKFLTQCTRKRARKNTLDALRITLKSEHLLGEMLQNLPLEFSYRRTGKLILISTPKELASASASCAIKKQAGCNTQVLSVLEAQRIEPAIEALTPRYAGAIYSQNDAIGDAAVFCDRLCHWLIEHSDTKLMTSTSAHGLITHNGVLHATDTSNGVIKADAMIVCLGSWSGSLLKHAGIYLPIYPVRGYSISMPPGNATPSVCLTDARRRLVIGRLANSVRIAGFADFLGFDESHDSARIQKLLETAHTIAPEAANYDVSERHEWGGFRPLTPSGLPLVGSTSIKGLYLNTGHGALGWTMACASGHDAAASVAQR